MKINKIILGIFSALCLSTNFLISAAVIENNTYEIKYENINNIETNNLISKFDSTQNTKLTKAKAKKGFIFLGWKTNNGTTIDIIPSGFNKNIVLSPILINEYNSYSTIKKLFLDSSKEIYYDTKIKQINQLINNEENTFGHEKYQLQKLIVEAINNFDNEVRQDDMPNSQFRIGGHASSESKVEKTIDSTVTATNTQIPSIWSMLWDELKNWWNIWLGTAFYGLVGVGATIGIGYSAYTSYWKNKRNFKLKKDEKLKVTLEIHLKEENNKGHWYGLFYNNNTSIQTDCSCQRRFIKKEKSDTMNNNLLFVSYILTNELLNPSLLLYNLDGENNNGEENYYTNKFIIKDYYPGSNIIPFYAYNSKNNTKEKIGNLVISREVITENNFNDICEKIMQENKNKCKLSCHMNENNSKKCCIAIEKNQNNINNTNIQNCSCSEITHNNK
ncbi:hypothetical protein [Mycoplasma phocimorsus]|uniref:hypothetical protein n=1 Tax=Mycoplasma phocimorsus TaxID=3045839 RepID=UPI0024C0A241|nr:hypothetical protein [Mycoplasma phocimorsus]MDJ1648933.1 hypothetical protein [Mycoplasma phocimorsus]